MVSQRDIVQLGVIQGFHHGDATILGVFFATHVRIPKCSNILEPVFFPRFLHVVVKFRKRGDSGLKHIPASLLRMANLRYPAKK